jgi:hypothetical protein
LSLDGRPLGSLRFIFKYGAMISHCSSDMSCLLMQCISSQASTKAYIFLEISPKFLEQYGRILSFDLNTIETIGGGSARCMMAEIFSIREPGFE